MTLLIGFAVDVSGSMQESIRNASLGPHRLGAVADSLRALADRVRRSPTMGTTSDDRGGIHTFVYAFGLRDLPDNVGDLLSLLRPDTADAAAETRDDGDPYLELGRLAGQYDLDGWRSWIHRNLSPPQARTLAANLRHSPGRVEELVSLLPAISAAEAGAVQDFAGGDRSIFTLFQASKAAGGAIAHPVRTTRDLSNLQAAERLVRELTHDIVGAEIGRRLVAPIDTTLPLDAAASLLTEAGTGTGVVEQMLYGDTPMCRVLGRTTDRFRRELERPDRGYRSPVLVVVSDGQSTDGDPRGRFAQVKAAGVTVVACYVTDRDTVVPRTLPARPEPGWDDGARAMFDGASEVAPDNSYTIELRERGWAVPDGGRYFVQLNHSAVLSELLEALSRP